MKKKKKKDEANVTKWEVKPKKTLMKLKEKKKNETNHVLIIIY